MKFESKAFPEANRRFFKTAKVVEWLRAEKEAWQWLESLNDKISIEARQSINRNLSNALRAIENEPNDNVANVEQQLKNLSILGDQKSWVPAKSNLGQYIIEESSQDAELAAAMLYLAMRSRRDSFPNTTRILLEAATTLTAFQRGLTRATAEITARQIAGIKGSLGELYDSAKSNSEQLIDSIDKSARRKEAYYKRVRTIISKRLRSEKDRFASVYGELFRSHQIALDGEFKKAHSEIREFKDYYETKIALLEPVSYWTRKSTAHSTATVFIGGLFITYSIILIHLGRRGFAFLWSQFDDPVAGLSGLSIGAIALITLIVALALIGSRILYRLFLSQLHLWNDASERVTMIKTYLAFVKKGHSRDEHLSALMLRLYSPASDGVVKDDFGSSNTFESLLGKLGKS